MSKLWDQGLTCQRSHISHTPLAAGDMPALDVWSDPAISLRSVSFAAKDLWGLMLNEKSVVQMYWLSLWTDWAEVIAFWAIQRPEDLLKETLCCTFMMFCSNSHFSSSFCCSHGLQLEEGQDTTMNVEISMDGLSVRPSDQLILFPTSHSLVTHQSYHILSCHIWFCCSLFAAVFWAFRICCL